jgi:hypothetical protein
MGARRRLPIEADRTARLFAVALLGGVAAGCTASHPVVIHGDADSVAVSYVNDLAGAAAVARLHCARYERVPRLDQTQPNVAYFDCVRP